MTRLKSKPLKVSGAAAHLADLKVFGDEPTFAPGHTLSLTEELTTLNWYSYICDVSNAREYLESYLAKSPEIVAKLKKLPDYAVPRTAAWVVRIESRGARFANPKSAWVLKKLDEAFVSYLNVPEEAAEEPKPNVLARVRDKAGDFIGDIEEALDKRDYAFKLYDYLSQNNVSGRVANQIVDYYEPLKEELEDALDGDEEVKEGYAGVPKAELKARLAFVSGLLDDAEKFTDNKRAQRKPRKKKVKTADKILQFFKPKPKDDEHKIVSVNPVAVLGAQEVWTFNTTYGILTVMRADGPGGLNVHRTAITGYDEKTSVSKRIGRKAHEILPQVTGGGKVVRRKLMDRIKTAAINPIKDRVNEDVILLYVSKT